MRQPYGMATTAGEALTVLFPSLSIVTSFRLEGVWRGERGESDGGRRIWASAVVLKQSCSEECFLFAIKWMLNEAALFDLDGGHVEYVEVESHNVHICFVGLVGPRLINR